MTTDRREFLNRIAGSSAVLGGLSMGLPFSAAEALVAGDSRRDSARQGTWDTSWPERLTGRVRAVFDVPEVESGLGVWRASIWAIQYAQTMGTPASELSTALVLRHNAIVLAMQQTYWDRYGVGKDGKVLHPVTGAPTTKNPALLGPADGLGAPAEFRLDRFHARGGVTLACDLALQQVISVIVETDKVTPAVARERAIGLIVPGVILQPSGVFAIVLAQQVKQALYVRAS